MVVSIWENETNLFSICKNVKKQQQQQTNNKQKKRCKFKLAYENKLVYFYLKLNYIIGQIKVSFIDLERIKQ